jgi:hypothetical protein
MKSSFTCAKFYFGALANPLIEKCHRVTAQMAFFVFLIGIISGGSAHAQIAPAAAGAPGMAMPASLRMRQDLNNYLWQFDAARSFALTPRWQWRFSEQFRTSMLRLSSRDEKWKDDHSFSTALGFQLRPALRLDALFRSLSFYDRQTGFNNDVRSHAVAAGAHFSPSPALRFSTQAGPKWESRLGFRDRGYYISGDAALAGLEWGGYVNSVQALLEMDSYAVRKNHDANVSYGVSRVFSAASADSLRFFSNSRRRDNYTSLLGDVESQREGNKGFENILTYGIGPWARLLLRTNWQFRNVELVSFGAEQAERQRKRNDQLGDHAMEIMVAHHRLQGRMVLSYYTQTQKYDIAKGNTKSPFSQYTAFITPDNSSRRLQWNGELSTPVGRRDSLYAYASISRFQYDTPDTNNFDDRDELRINSQFIYGRQLRPALRLELQGSVSLYHMVYIFGERSADNSWNRILRLRPIVRYLPSERLQWHHSFEVLANYVDYDFDNLAVQTKSFVFRKFAWEDSLRLAVTRCSALRLDYRLQLEENGQLYWDEWRERVLTTRESNWLQLRLTYAASRSFSIAPGYGFYDREEWRHERDALGNETKTRSQNFSSHGPALSISYSPSRRTRFIFDAQRRLVKPYQQRHYTINTLDVRLDWLF